MFALLRRPEGACERPHAHSNGQWATVVKVDEEAFESWCAERGERGAVTRKQKEDFAKALWEAQCAGRGSRADPADAARPPEGDAEGLLNGAAAAAFEAVQPGGGRALAPKKSQPCKWFSHGRGMSDHRPLWLGLRCDVAAAEQLAAMPAVLPRPAALVLSDGDGGGGAGAQEEDDISTVPNPRQPLPYVPKFLSHCSCDSQPAVSGD